MLVSANQARLKIDLDTIDLSNLNRQFLFQKQHIGQPKAIVARESALRFNPHANIVAIHGSTLVISPHLMPARACYGLVVLYLP